MKRLILILVMAALTCLPTLSFADVVYDNGLPNQANGNEMTLWIQAEDFTLQNTTTITDVHFWTIENPTVNGFSGSIFYGIYADNGGTPNLGAPAVEGFLQGANLTRDFTGISGILGVYDEYAYSFDTVPFTAQAGVTYWIGLHNGSLDNTARAEVYWESTNDNGTIFGNEDELAPAGDGWFSNGQEHAFQLTATTVPEPSTFLLLGAGLAGVGLLRRKLKN